MKKILAIGAAAVTLIALADTADPTPRHTADLTPRADLTRFVDPFIGTGGHGHTFPGAIVPRGMIQPSPDTRINEWDACSGYHYSDSTINGFTQTHLSGTGCADYGDFLFMPTVGGVKLDPQIDTVQYRPYASAFSHEREQAKPGYYSVMLDTYGIRAEIAAAPRSAIYRFTYPEAKDPGMVIDLDYSIQTQRNLMMDVEVVSDREIRASKMTRYWAFDQQLSMTAEFSKPFTHVVVRDTITDSKGRPMPRCKVVLTFPETKQGEELLVKVGVSAVDTDGARANLSAEIPGWDFEAVRRDAHDRWNRELSRIEIDTPDDSTRTIFYTSLYHTAIVPSLFTDVDGRYLGMDRKPHVNPDPERPVYTIFSLWDTHRALHPLLTLTEPRLNNDLIRSLLMKYEEGGLLPMWELAGNYTATMTGYHAVSLMADALTKGISDFDPQLALRAACRSAEGDTTGIKTPELVRLALMPKSKDYKNTLGFIPSDAEHESVAKGLEYAYDDWCISLLANAANNPDTAALYAKRGENWRNYYDPATKFMRGRMADGSWREPFNPYGSNHRSDDYCEGTAWQWNWFVPHNPEGLMQLMGGKEAFEQRLDSLFTAESKLEGELVSADITGLIGQYAHGNEPSHHIIHLYNYADRPDRVQELVTQVMTEMYNAGKDGLSGNEDCGQMSAWYLLNAMGLYQVCPGKPVWSLGRPWIEKAVIHSDSGKDITIRAEGFAPGHDYVERITLNGKPLEKPFVNHADLANGGELVFYMTDKPTKQLR